MEQAADRMYSTQAEQQMRYIAIFGTRTRFILLVLVLLCLTSIWSNILTFNFAVICMGPDTSINSTASNEDTYTFTSGQKSWVISAVAIAALISNFPVVAMVNKLGIRTVFTGLGCLSAIATLIIPFAIRLGYPYFLAVRVLQGIAFAANFPVIGAFCAKWTYYKQNGLFVSALVAYVQLSPAFTNPASGALCNAFRWPSIFYAHGTVSLILFITYGLFYRNNPNKHPFVGDVEKNKINIGKAQVDKKSMKKIPYAEILRTPAIWATWLASLGNFTCVNMMFLFSPTYLSTVLNYSVQFLDRIHFVSEQTKFRFFNTLAFCGSCSFLVALAFWDTRQTNFCTFLLGGAAGILGATTGGFFKAAPVLSKQYSHFVTGNISLGITITMLIVPFYVNNLTVNNTPEEWRWVFIITGSVMVVTNLIFVIFIKGEPCEWTEDDFTKRNSVKSISEIRAQGTSTTSNDHLQTQLKY
ncbi:unnamed protein product, partial [Mesorhabditis belari]|uniref:Major facilitator superfamily (MFS) profile domain-containing protein n=1 Tax=Mesorhabditis belari TaxID=2138241 RepID=A0AAF3F522_9BILA